MLLATRPIGGARSLLARRSRALVWEGARPRSGTTTRFPPRRQSIFLLTENGAFHPGRHTNPAGLIGKNFGTSGLAKERRLDERPAWGDHGDWRCLDCCC